MNDKAIAILMIAGYIISMVWLGYWIYEGQRVFFEMERERCLRNPEDICCKEPCVLFVIPVDWKCELIGISVPLLYLFLIFICYSRGKEE